MTLYRQLLIWMLIIFFTLITSVFVIQFNTTRNFLREHQTTEIDNAVSAVGMALAPYLETGDDIAMESVINATFDGSFYNKVSLELFQENKKIERAYPAKITGVPEWFRSRIEITSITRTSTLTSGWMQLGELTVTSNPAHAYQKLWHATMQLVFGFSITFLFGGVLLVFILSRVLHPLKAIQKSAKAMSKNQFGKPLQVPHTRELSDVVKAFNHMSAQLKMHFEQQAQEADRLRIRAFQDPVSGLANRSYLITQLQSWLNGSSKGGVVLLRVDLIKDSYEKSGYEAGDKLVEKLANRIKSLTSDNFTIARLTQAEFILLAPNTSTSELVSLGRSMLHMSEELHSDPLDVSPVQAAVGVVVRNESDTISTILAQADNALTQARQQPKEPLTVFDNAQQAATMGKLQWKALVDEAIANNLFRFKFQKAINDNGETLHKEVFAYIQKGEERYTAGQFVGAVEQLNAGPQLDMHIIEQLFKKLEDDPELGPIAVNITQSSISDTGFIRWLCNKMKANQDLSERILFELPEISFIKHSNDTDLLCEMIHQNSFAFGIDNFGHNFSSVSYLSKVLPAYVKLDFAYTTQVDNEVKADLLTSITRTASNLSITAIASRVETTRQINKLAEMQVKGFQGFVVDEMKREEAV